MAQLPQTFTSKVVAPQGTAQMLPLGEHPMVITASEMKQVKDKPNCGYLEFTVHIIDGEAKGMEGSYRLNLYHDNETTVRIAEQQLSSIAHVTGNVDGTGRCTAVDSSQFHNLPFIGVVSPQKNKPDYTEISGVKHITGEQPGKASAAGPAAAPAPPSPPQQAPQAPVQPAAAQQAAPAWGGAPAPAQAQPAAPQWGNQAPAAAAPATQPTWAAPQPAAGAAAPWAPK